MTQKVAIGAVALVLLTAAAASTLPARAVVADAGLALTVNDPQRALDGLQDASLGAPAAARLYDLGLAYDAAGDHPRALAATRAAWELAPRSGDAVHNLAVLRLRFTDAPTPVGTATPWGPLLTSGELAVLAVLVWIGSAVVTRRWQRGELPTQLAAATTAAAFVLSLPAIWGMNREEEAPVGVLVQGAAVRGAPELTERPLFKVGAGAEVRVDARTDELLRIEDGQGRRGWVPIGAVYVPAWGPHAASEADVTPPADVEPSQQG